MPSPVYAVAPDLRSGIIITADTVLVWDGPPSPRLFQIEKVGLAPATGPQDVPESPRPYSAPEVAGSPTTGAGRRCFRAPYDAS